LKINKTKSTKKIEVSSSLKMANDNQGKSKSDNKIVYSSLPDNKLINHQTSLLNENKSTNNLNRKNYNSNSSENINEKNNSPYNDNENVNNDENMRKSNKINELDFNSIDINVNDLIIESEVREDVNDRNNENKEIVVNENNPDNYANLTGRVNQIETDNENNAEYNHEGSEIDDTDKIVEKQTEELTNTIKVLKRRNKSSPHVIKIKKHTEQQNNVNKENPSGKNKIGYHNNHVILNQLVDDVKKLKLENEKIHKQNLEYTNIINKLSAKFTESEKKNKNVKLYLHN